MNRLITLILAAICFLSCAEESWMPEDNSRYYGGNRGSNNGNNGRNNDNGNGNSNEDYPISFA